LEILETKIAQLDKELRETSELLQTIERKYKALEISVTEARKELKANFADNEYWANINKKVTQESCPWYSEKLRLLQIELLISALALHEAFIFCANTKTQKITSTLTAFFYYLNGNYALSSEQVKAMWDIFFLVVPIVSTTFASVQTLFKGLGEQEIPWLFIDEAAQSVPQAAAGAIWRSKRVVVAGNPQQGKPKVAIPNAIAKNLQAYFKLNSEITSIQSVIERVHSWIPFGNAEN
jgi:hypothetical protein